MPSTGILRELARQILSIHLSGDPTPLSTLFISHARTTTEADLHEAGVLNLVDFITLLSDEFDEALLRHFLGDNYLYVHNPLLTYFGDRLYDELVRHPMSDTEHRAVLHVYGMAVQLVRAIASEIDDDSDGSDLKTTRERVVAAFVRHVSDRDHFAQQQARDRERTAGVIGS